MVCTPSSNNINIPAPGPGPSLPGLGLPFSIPKPPFPDIKLPEGVPEDLIDLVSRIFALFPQGIKFVPNTDALTKGVWDALASLFNQLSPFLAFYKFIQAALNIILCIIDVLCALFNPWATASALKRLFKKCLPDFLSLFPWIALIIMILALIILLIELIKYIIMLIISYIKQIVENIKVLTRAFTVADSDSILAAVNKLAYLICMIEQLFSIFMAIAAIFAVIKPLMEIGGRGVCRGGSNGDSCCTDDFCPSFIRNSTEGGFGSDTGRLIYFRKIKPNTPSDTSFDWLRNFDISLRAEKWQFVDDFPGDAKFLDIIVPSPKYGFTYWPEGESYDADSNIVRMPYLMDMNIWLDPADWGNPGDANGLRQFNIRDIIVSQRPTVYPESWNGEVEETNPISGAIVLVGGSVYEYTDDGYSQYRIGGKQATLQTLVHKDPLISNSIPTIDDGYNFLDVSYKFRYQHEVLVDKKLITAMCQPDVSLESEVLNAEFNDHLSVLDKIGDLPDIGTLNGDRTDGTGTLGCLARALTKFRRNLNENSALEFQSEAIACLDALLSDSYDYYCRGTAATVDRYTSDLEINPDLQWINKEINVTVRLRDKSGTQIAVNVDQVIGNCLSKQIVGKVTLGEITSFTYDGYGEFNAVITSSVPGAGELTATINNESFVLTINRDNDEATKIIERVVPYEFIDKTTNYRREQADEVISKYGPHNIAEDGN